MHSYSERPHRDRVWAVLYVALVGASLAGGIYAVLNRNPHYDAVFIKGDYLSDPAHCPPLVPRVGGQLLGGLAAAVPPPAWSRALVSATTRLASKAADWSPTYFVESAGVLFGASAAAALVLSLLFLLGLQTHPLALVYLAVVVQVLAPLGVAALAFLAGQDTFGWLCTGVSVVIALSFYFSQESTKLVARLLGLSARALRSNWGLVLLTVALNLCLIALLAALALSGTAALAVGDVRFNPRRAAESGACADAAGKAVSCCVWAPAALLAPLLVPASAAAVAWSVLLAFQIKVFTISGCVAQWYFAPAGTSGTPGAILRSLGHASGPSLGSLCLAGLVAALMRYLRAAILRVCRRRSGDDGAVPSLSLGSLASCGCGVLFTLLEQLSKFSVVRMSMTGDSFWTAGQDTFSLLRRNAMDAYSAWWFPPVVLYVASTVLSAVWGYGVYTGAVWYWGLAGGGALGAQSASEKAAWHSAIVLSTLSGALTFMALQFFCGIVLNIVDAVFICYAVDRDHGTCSRVEVHEVYELLPGAHCGKDGCEGGHGDDESGDYAPYYLNRHPSLPTPHDAADPHGNMFHPPNPQPPTYHPHGGAGGRSGGGGRSGPGGRPSQPPYPYGGAASAAAGVPQPAYYMSPPPPPQYSQVPNSYDVVSPFAQSTYQGGADAGGRYGAAPSAPRLPPPGGKGGRAG